MIQTMQIPETAAIPPMTVQIEALEVGGKMKAPKKKRNYIAALISGPLKYRYDGKRIWSVTANPDNDQEVIIEREQ